jgi:hypothetical protein
MATVNSAVLTKVRRRYWPEKIWRSGDRLGLACVCSNWALRCQRSGSFTCFRISTETMTGVIPHRNMARQPKCAPTV